MDAWLTEAKKSCEINYFGHHVRTNLILELMKRTPAQQDGVEKRRCHQVLYQYAVADPRPLLSLE